MTKENIMPNTTPYTRSRDWPHDTHDTCRNCDEDIVIGAWSMGIGYRGADEPFWLHTKTGQPDCTDDEVSMRAEPACRRLSWNRYRNDPFPERGKLVGRGTKYGNPFKVKKYGHQEALCLHRLYLQDDPGAVAQAQADGWRWAHIHGANLRASIRVDLYGYDLVCPGCGPDDDCHADLLLLIARESGPTTAMGNALSATHTPDVQENP